MVEARTEVIMVGHILENEIVFKLYEAIKDADVDVKYCEISFTTLKEGIERKRPSTMRCYLTGPLEEREKAVKTIEQLAKENDLGVETINYDELWAKK
jgi:ACT domain-containing protein